MVSARPAVQQLPAYRPGRNPADLAREIGVERAVKLASNEVAFPPLPAVVEALAAAASRTSPAVPRVGSCGFSSPAVPATSAA